jgi:hypothetical protein
MPDASSPFPPKSHALPDASTQVIALSRPPGIVVDVGCLSVP